MKPAKTAYNYTRFSTTGQADGTSEERQTDDAELYAKRHGLRLSEKTFSDRGVSAFRGKHRKQGALRTLLELVKPGEVILIENLDRWSREDPFDSVNEIRACLNRGVEFVFIKEDVVVTSESYEQQDQIKYMLFFGGMRANGESKRKRELIKKDWDKKRALARSGKPARINRLPCWLSWDTDAGKAVVNNTKAKIVRNIFELARDGQKPLEIVRQLRKAGTPSVSSQKGAEWNTVLIRRLLANKAVLGFYTQVEPNVPNVWPLIIDEALFHAVQRNIDIQPVDKRPGSKKGQSETNLFTGLAVCGCCNRYNLNSHIGGVNGTPKLLCQGGHRGQSDDCGHASVPTELVEKSCLHFLATADLIRPLLASEQKLSKLPELEARLHDAQKQVQKLSAFIMGDDSPSPTLYERLKLEEAKAVRLRSEIEDEQQRERTEKPATLAYEEFNLNLPALREDKGRRPELRKAIASVIEKLVLDPRGVKGEKGKRSEKSIWWNYNLHLRGGSAPVRVTIVRDQLNGDTWMSRSMQPEQLRQAAA